MSRKKVKKINKKLGKKSIDKMCQGCYTVPDMRAYNPQSSKLVTQVNKHNLAKMIELIKERFDGTPMECIADAQILRLALERCEELLNTYPED